MTALLLDTHVLLWWLADDPRLGPEARKLIARETVSVSTASLWEIAIKSGLGKLQADIRAITLAIDAQGMRRIGIGDDHLKAYQDLPRDSQHGDPFDRMLVCQSSCEPLPVLTADDKLTRYGIETIDARL